jgi:hypothetical protein
MIIYQAERYNALLSLRHSTHSMSFVRPFREYKNALQWAKDEAQYFIDNFDEFKDFHIMVYENKEGCNPKAEIYLTESINESGHANTVLHGVAFIRETELWDTCKKNDGS